MPGWAVPNSQEWVTGTCSGSSIQVQVIQENGATFKPGLPSGSPLWSRELQQAFASGEEGALQSHVCQCREPGKGSTVHRQQRAWFPAGRKTPNTWLIYGMKKPGNVIQHKAYPYCFILITAFQKYFAFFFFQEI